MYGYRVNEVPLLALPKCKSDLRIGASQRNRDVYNSYRTVLSVSLPFYIRGATPPRPDPSHPLSLVAGVVKRFGVEPPKPDPGMLKHFKRFVTLWCKHNLKPLETTEILSVESWLETTDYSRGRKTNF